MGWYLNEVFTDTGAMPAILAYLAEHPRSILPASADQPSAFREALEALHINMSLMEDRHVPAGYEGDMHNWSADDVLELFPKLGLLLRHEQAVEITDLGTAILRKEVSTVDALAAGMYYWTEQTRSGLPYRPAIALLNLLEQLHEKQPPPCPGLLLPEAVMTLKMMHWGEDVSVCLDRLLDWREEAMASVPDSATTAFGDEEVTRRASVCVNLAELMKPRDICRVQATLIHVISGALATYGDLYGQVQYITLNNGLRSRIQECRTYPGGRLELAQSLTWSGL